MFYRQKESPKVFRFHYQFPLSFTRIHAMDHISVTDVRSNPGDSAFLIDDGKTAILYDSGFGFTGFAIAQNIKAVLKDRSLDYILLTHSHYDHALASAYIRRIFPSVKIVAHAYAAYVFTRPGAIQTMKQLDKSNARQCGFKDYEFLGDELRVDIPVTDGDIIHAGDMDFEVLGLEGHTRCSVGFYCRQKRLLLSSETLGVYDGKTTITASFLVGYACTMKSIDKVLALDIKHVIAPHLGLLTMQQTQFYLGNIRQANLDVAQFIACHIRAGESTECIIEAFKDRYLHGYIKSIYPMDAMRLNTSIMIELLKRELQIPSQETSSPTDSDLTHQGRPED